MLRSIFKRDREFVVTLLSLLYRTVNSNIYMLLLFRLQICDSDYVYLLAYLVSREMNIRMNLLVYIHICISRYHFFFLLHCFGKRDIVVDFITSFFMSTFVWYTYMYKFSFTFGLQHGSSIELNETHISNQGQMHGTSTCRSAAIETYSYLLLFLF